MATVNEIAQIIQLESNELSKIASNAAEHRWNNQQIQEAYNACIKASVKRWVDLLGDPITKHLHSKGQL